MKALKFLDTRAEEVVVAVSLALMFVSISIQVFMRYVMQNSLSWSEELARYLFVLFVNLGISYGVKEKRHIRVEMITMWLSPKMQIVVRIIADLVFMAFALVVIYYGFKSTLMIMASKQDSPALELPMWIVYGVLPISYCAVTMRLIQSIIESFKSLKGGAT